MNWKAFFIGAGVGAIGGYVLNEALSQNKHIAPEKILKHVKNEFKKQGPIQGSWIQMNLDSFKKGPLQYKVYKGGIFKDVNGTSEQYEFVADANTGTVLEVTPFHR